MNDDRTRLEAAMIRALRDAWGVANEAHFRRALRSPALALDDSTRRLGGWHAPTRTITFSRQLVWEQPWPVVVEVLKHEIAHQYVDEVLRVTDEPPHGPAFRRVCQQMGLDPAAAGLPDRSGAQHEEPLVFRRVRKLLALAGSSNVHEAQAAMNAAQKLLLVHNLEATDLEGGERTYRVRHVGEPKLRFEAAERVLAGLLAEHFFVRVVWVPAHLPARGRTGRVLELAGTPENLEIAAYVHGWLLETADRLWQAHKRATGIGGDRGRLRFRSGVMMGFREKLAAQARACKEEGLVWIGDGDLQDYVSRRHPVLRRRAPTSLTADRHYAEGMAAGRKLVLNRPICQNNMNKGRALSGPSGRTPPEAC